jgi:hypothetical protein
MTMANSKKSDKTTSSTYIEGKSQDGLLNSERSIMKLTKLILSTRAAHETAKVDYDSILESIKSLTHGSQTKKIKSLMDRINRLSLKTHSRLEKARTSLDSATESFTIGAHSKATKKAAKRAKRVVDKATSSIKKTKKVAKKAAKAVMKNLAKKNSRVEIQPSA